MLFVLLVFAGPVLAQPLPGALQRALNEAGIPLADIGLVVQDPGEARPALAVGENRVFNPASVMKLVTTLAGLDTLGPAHTWRTGVWVDGEVQDGVLEGDLILVGGGDPSLTLERFWLLLREARARGLREIRGEVRIDNGLYDIAATDPGEFDNAPLKSYNAAPTALLVNYNTVALRLAPGPAGLAARLDPPALPVDNAVRIDRRAPCDGRDRIDVVREGDVLRVSGRHTETCGERVLWLNLLCPPATVAVYFRALWRELGGAFDGAVRLGPRPDTARLWLEFDSPPLAQVVRDINKHSNNVMAKMLYLNLGLAHAGAPATWDKADAALRAWLARRGLDIPELALDNGSGLSRVERISAASMARLLDWATRQPLYFEFAASLPALGQEGTQRRRLNGTALAGRGWLKSGTLNGVRNFAGYVLDREGRRRIVVLFVNHANAARAAPVQEALIEWAVNGSGSP